MGYAKPVRNIVIVDDIKFHLFSIQQRLKDQYDIYPAQSVEELMDVLKAVKPELILMDVNMPEINGYDAIKMLKENPEYAGIPVMFMTALVDRKSVLRGMQLGAADFIGKPFSDEQLIAHIENVCDPEKQAADRPIILAVDDNISTLKTISSFLQVKYKISTLPDPLKLEDLLKRVTPDLFLLDCLMPERSGFELIPIIRKYPEHEETPIIFLTSEATADNLSAVISSGAKDFLSKPINEEILNKKIALHTKDYMMHRRLRML